MSLVGSFMVTIALGGMLILGGRGVLRPFPQPAGAPSRLLVWALAGLVGLHTGMTALDLAGVPWSSLTVGLLGGLALALNLLPPYPRPTAAEGPPGRWSWGLLLAAAGALALAWAAVSLWTTNPDFIYHWGIKGHRFFLTGGVDEGFLQRPWNRLSHPDYPFLQPQIFVATALFRGFFDEPAMLLQTALWCLLTAVAARQAMRAGDAGEFSTEATTAAVGLSLAMFSVAHLLSGGPDVILSLVLAAAAAPLLAPAETRGQPSAIRPLDLQLALAAAVGAAAKMEGVPLAAVMLAAYGWRQRLWRRPWPFRRLLLLAAPTAVVVFPWWVRVQALGIAGRANAGPFEWEHWRAIAPELLRSLIHPHWNGMALLLALALPLAFLDRRVRPLLAVALAQLLLYVYVYFTALEAPEVHVRSSFTRVLCHVVPAVLVAVCLAFDGWAAALERKGRAQKAPISARPQTLP